jgi:hypothetical protein
MSVKATDESRPEAEIDHTTLPGARLQHTVQPTAASDASLTHQPRARALTEPSTDEISLTADKAKADQVQRDARQQWYAATRDSPDASLRLQTLEHWAQHPDDGLDPLSYGLVDENEAVRTRAQELYAQQLARDAAAVSVHEEPPAPPAE